MNRILQQIALALAARRAGHGLGAGRLEGRWKNPKGSVIVNVAPLRRRLLRHGQLGQAPGTATRASRRGTPACSATSGRSGDGIYKGRAFEPKRNISGSATVRQVGPNVMVVKGCAVIGPVLQVAALDARQLSAKPLSAGDPAASTAA